MLISISARRSLLPAIALVLAALAPPSRAQLSITATTIVDGQAGVTPTDSVHITFTFSRRLPFNSLFTPKFHWEPVGAWQRPYVFLDADRQNPRFTVLHRPETDFSVYVFGVAAQNGDRMERPFVMNYSTSASMGSSVVTGSVSLGTRTPASTALKLGAAVLEAHAVPESAARRALKPAAADADRGGVEVVSRTPRPVSHDVFAKQASGAAADEDRTVVLLLDAYDIDDGTWSVRAAAAVQVDGTFSFNHIRDGDYYPVAVNWTDETGETVGAFGYHDADGDYAPDVVSVSDGGASGVDVTIYPYASSSGLAHRFIAEDAAVAIASDAVLMSTSTPTVATDGSATEWTFVFYSPSSGNDISVVVDPLTVSTFVSASTVTIAPAGVPTGVIDSDAAVAAADANGGTDFRNEHPGVVVSARGGYALDAFPSTPEDLIWTVTYTPGVGSTDPPLVIHLDMSDGSVKTGTADDEGSGLAEVLAPYPNPFHDEANVDIRLDRRDAVTIDVFDLLGRRVERLFDGNLGAGTHGFRMGGSAAAGVYVIRVETSAQTITKQVVKVGS